MPNLRLKGDSMLTKAAPVEELKFLADAVPGTFEGYASIFGEKDLGGDVVMPGAFAGSLMRRPAQRVKMLWQHDTEHLIGVWDEMAEDARGLRVKGRLLLDVEKGKEANALLAAGALDGLSIGYRTIKSETLPDGGRKLMELDLREVSMVTFPMLESAGARLVKGDALPTPREFEAWLKRDAGFTAQQAKAIIAEGYKSIQSERDAGENGDGVALALQQLAGAFRR